MSLCSKIRCSLTYLKIWRHMWMWMWQWMWMCTHILTYFLTYINTLLLESEIAFKTSNEKVNNWKKMINSGRWRPTLMRSRAKQSRCLIWMSMPNLYRRNNVAPSEAYLLDNLILTVFWHTCSLHRVMFRSVL